MPKTVETYRTTKALRALVRRAAKLVDKRPSEFLRQAAEELDGLGPAPSPRLPPLPGDAGAPPGTRRKRTSNRLRPNALRTAFTQVDRHPTARWAARLRGGGPMRRGTRPSPRESTPSPRTLPGQPPGHKYFDK